MSTPPNAMPPQSTLHAQPPAPRAIPPTQVFLWSVRRELWEYRSIYIAPLIVAALIIFGFLISTVHLPSKMRAAMALGPMQQQEFIEKPYDFAALLLMGTTFLVAIFYSLDALYGERRDRSILFWKSLPVSDVTTVLSKASIPIVVLPLLTFVITFATQWIMLLINSAVLIANGMSVAPLWSHLTLVHTFFMIFYHLLAIHGLWYAPIYAWLLLVSAWARRAPFLWAALPPLVIGVLEKIAFNSSHFVSLLGSSVAGPDEPTSTAGQMSMDALTQPAPSHFLLSPHLWLGLATAAIFLAIAIRLRRNREPI